MYSHLLFSIIICFCDQIFSQKSLPIVQSRVGGIQGHYKTSFNKRQYAAYEGVPYALPPIGPRRFQPPDPIPKWVGNLTATKVSSECVQFAHAFSNKMYQVTGDEDCLYLNIYVPDHDDTGSLAVLFTIHGGAYQWASAYTGVEFLMDKDIIVVTPNYRLGIFGFLSTEDHLVSGNMGLKDQSLALKWVSENIEYFGGDPRRITLIGLSAGASSVHYHYLSPMSKGLFQNGLSFSGTAFGPADLTENSREKAYKLAAILGCETDDIKDMVECLRYRPARPMAAATKHFMPWLYNPFTPFGPVVEQPGGKTFIDRCPVEIISTGDVADVLWITGIVSEEGLYPAAEFVNNDKYLEELDRDWNKIAPHLLDFNFTIPLEKHSQVARKIRKYYFGNKPIDRQVTKELIDSIGDRLYTVPAETSTKLQAKVNKSPVLLWYYTYRANNSISDEFSRSTNNYALVSSSLLGIKTVDLKSQAFSLNDVSTVILLSSSGVSHGDDFDMIYNNGLIYPPKLETDRAMQLILIDFVVSVAEKGYPDVIQNVEWKKVDPKQKSTQYLHFAGPDDIRMGVNENFGHKDFWDSIDFNENRLYS